LLPGWDPAYIPKTKAQVDALLQPIQKEIEKRFAASDLKAFEFPRKKAKPKFCDRLRNKLSLVPAEVETYE